MQRKFSEKIVIGTRGSKLSVAQTKLIPDALMALWADLNIETTVITTKGDTDQSPIPLDTVGKAWFTGEIEEALSAGTIDIAVHSLKDVPPEIVAGSMIIPVLKREDPRDVLISKDGSAFIGLKEGAVIGTDSSRRRAQLLAMRPDLVVRSIRGNVDTRLRKLREEDYDAIVIAAAGLARLGMIEVVTEFFDAKEFIPAPGQGVLAAQVRAVDTELIEMLQRIQDPGTAEAVEAERAFIDTVGGGCKSPIGACALVEGGTLTLYGMMAEDDGTRMTRDMESGLRSDGASIGASLAKRMLVGRTMHVI